MTGSSLNAFKGTIAQERKLKDVIAKHKDMPGALLPVLQEAQGIYGYLPIEVQQMVADGLEISLSEVYGVATFYSQFSLTPKGEHRISVCLGTACYVKGADKILAAIEEKLGIKSERILAEDKALDTIENFKYSIKLIQQDSRCSQEEALNKKIAVVTSSFHLSRAKKISALLGLKNICLVEAKVAFVFIPNVYAREICSWLKLDLRILYNKASSGGKKLL